MTARPTDWREDRELRFSVAICTRNRAALLAKALTSLMQQHLPCPAFEVLVVDNGSTDETPQVAASFLQYWPHMRIVREPTPGLSHARNRALREAQGAYIAFLDDDALAPPSWLSVAARLVEERGPSLFGGPFRACLDEPAPRWFRPAYASYEPRAEAGPLAPHEYIPGANFFISRSLLQRLGGFDPAYGKSAGRARYGEETELLLRARDVLPADDIWFVPELFVYHRVDPRFFPLAHWFAQAYLRGVGFGQQRQSRLPALSPWEVRLRTGWNLARVGFGGTVGVRLRNRERFPFAQNYLVERLGERVFTLGALYGRSRAQPDCPAAREDGP